MTTKQQQVIAQLKNKQIVVLGAGLTGLSCVRFLQRNGISCCVNDSRKNIIGQEEFSQSYPDCQLFIGSWQTELLANAEVILLSPGIDLEKEQLTDVINEQCQVIGDVELFCQINEKPVIAVTGSNGKSTVVSLLAHVGDQLGFKTALGGNIGTPVLDQLSADVDFYILELSSFQLETIESLKALAATVLNVSDDHLDRHKTLANYSEIKQKVYQQSRVCIVNRDDDASYSLVNKNDNTIISFGSDEPQENQFGIANYQGELTLMYAKESLVSLSSLPLAGMHNALNYLAVLALGMSAQWSLKAMVKAFSSFYGLPHRCQLVGSLNNIRWINDSKATNVGAAIAAIEGLAPTIKHDNKLILIAGGDGKGADFSPLQRVLSSYVDYVIALGKDGQQILALTKQGCFVDTIEQAVFKANQIAYEKDMVLLSPACASIDMFKNFVERGNAFTKAVLDLKEAC